ncbi:MAG: hypothetical protein JSW62_03465 [Thermoplasmatales archaeon]|nr:MAG: hypothetical protein JSW62_03465 [Thermoplasmatales archaeon]
MNRYNRKTKEKLYELGTRVGLKEKDIDGAKKTAKTVIVKSVIAGIFALFGILSRLQAVGLWYVAVSIRDFSFFNNFF